MVLFARFVTRALRDSTALDALPHLVPLLMRLRAVSRALDNPLYDCAKAMIDSATALESAMNAMTLTRRTSLVESPLYRAYVVRRWVRNSERESMINQSPTLHSYVIMIRMAHDELFKGLHSLRP